MNDRFLELCKSKLDGIQAGAPGNYTAYCPFHDDKKGGKKSFSVSTEKGVWQCFSCGERGGMLKLVAKLEGITDPIEAKNFLGIAPRKVKEVPFDVISAAGAALLQDEGMLAWLYEHRGITKETVYARNLGYLPDQKRLTIPIYDEWTRPVDLRRHLVDKARHEAKSLPYKSGYASPRIYPAEVEAKSEVVLHAGELDALLSGQLGFPACTVTGVGEGGWAPACDSMLAGKKVYICYDCDTAGRGGAQRVAEALVLTGADVRIVDLELPGTKESKDFTDWIVKEGHTAEEFQLLLDSAPVFVPEKPTPSAEVADVDLNGASHAQHFGQTVRFKAVVAGKDMAPYIYPRRLRASCTMGRPSNVCGGCGLFGPPTGVVLEVPDDQDGVLKLIDCDDVEQRQEIASRLKIIRCGLWTYAIEEAGNIEQVQLIPEVDRSSETGAEYCMRMAYVIGHGIRPNAAYEFVGVSGASPKTQHAAPVLRDATPVQGSLSREAITPETLLMLEIFKVGACA